MTSRIDATSSAPDAVRFADMPLPEIDLDELYTSPHRGRPWRLMLSERSNEMTEHLWDLFAPHRSRVTALLEEQHRRVFRPAEINPPSAAHGTLCLLGAGNANDVDLRRLLRRFSTIELVDIDGAALERGAARQLSDRAAARVRLHGGVDLFGISEEDAEEDGQRAVVGSDGAAAGAPSVNASAAIAAFARRRVASTLRALLSRRCDVVASTGLFPMLALSLERLMGVGSGVLPPKPPGWDEALDALGRAYLDGLAAAVRRGGVVAHVSTLVKLRASEDVNPRDAFGEEEVCAHCWLWHPS